jgi:DNA-binding GntR family transcriptional regulator
VADPDGEDTAYFDLPPDGHVQVVEIRRIAFDQNENRIRLTVTIYRADRNRFVVNDGNVPRSGTHPE